MPGNLSSLSPFSCLYPTADSVRVQKPGAQWLLCRASSEAQCTLQSSLRTRLRLCLRSHPWLASSPSPTSFPNFLPGFSWSLPLINHVHPIPWLRSGFWLTLPGVYGICEAAHKAMHLRVGESLVPVSPLPLTSCVVPLQSRGFAMPPHPSLSIWET